MRKEAAEYFAKTAGIQRALRVMGAGLKGRVRPEKLLHEVRKGTAGGMGARSAAAMTRRGEAFEAGAKRLAKKKGVLDIIQQAAK